MIIKSFLAFGAGFISFLTPCVLPIIPGYISYISGRQLNDIENYKNVVLLKTILFSAGFSSVFITLGAAASSIGNVGPALGDLGPTNTFVSLPDLGKYWCAFLMLVGRLELFTVLILFTPYFWRDR